MVHLTSSALSSSCSDSSSVSLFVSCSSAAPHSVHLSIYSIMLMLIMFICQHLLVLVSFSLILNLTSCWSLLVCSLVCSLNHWAVSLTRADDLRDVSVTWQSVLCWCVHSTGVFSVPVILDYTSPKSGQIQEASKIVSNTKYASKMFIFY